MERRGWPWKKKSSEKTLTASGSTASLSNSAGNHEDQNGNTVNYVQISTEANEHLTELKDQVKILNEKLSAAQDDMTNKDNLVKQHAKVAEEAVSGWEKAEAESTALKNQLESITLSKLTAEERASHLNGALKECMKQIRDVKQESEQKLHDVVFAKTKQWEKVKAEFEAKLAHFEQELLRASAENDALSRSLIERSDLLMKVSSEKMQTETEIELLNSNLQSCEKEINSLKYELHVLSKELEIRNEEKNMCVKSADAANKQHLEDVKKISKLEAECQRLRGLVRKKLPGPAALAQMKLEVDNLSRDPGETRLRYSPGSIPAAAPDFASASIQTMQKENEFLTTRLLATEEETKMLKEALSKRNCELQATRDMFAKTATKLHTVEEQMLRLNRYKIPSKPSANISFDTILSQNDGKPPSSFSMSEDGLDEDRSCSESWATPIMSDVAQIHVEKETGKNKRTGSSNHLELMDDFLEMEELAFLTSESNKTTTYGELSKTNDELLGNVKKDDADKEQQVISEKSENHYCADKRNSAGVIAKDEFSSLFIKLESRIASTFQLQRQTVNISKILDDIRLILQDTQEELPQHSVSSVVEENYSIDVSCNTRLCKDDTDMTTIVDISSKKENTSCADEDHALNKELTRAISKIQDFVLSLRNEAKDPRYRPSDVQGLNEKMQQFSSCVKYVLNIENSLNNFICILSRVLSEASEMGLKMTFNMGNEWEGGISDCIDKVALLENRVAQHQQINENTSGNSVTSSSSYPEIDGPICENSEERNMTEKLSVEEFEQMRLEKEHVQIELSTCTELLEETKLRLVATEQNLEVLKSELAASEKSNSLSETQLKCMVESYKLLESRAQELEAEVDLLHGQVQTTSNELQEERKIHQGNLAKLRYLQEMTERNENFSRNSDVDIDIKTKQEKEIVAAAEKLAECQETILLLGRQLQALRPPAELVDATSKGMHLMTDADGAGVHGFPNIIMKSVPESESPPRTGADPQLHGCNSQVSPSDSEAISFPKSPINLKHQKHRSSRPSTSPDALPEKHGRGFSRFFSKGKSDNLF